MVGDQQSGEEPEVEADEREVGVDDVERDADEPTEPDAAAEASSDDSDADQPATDDPVDEQSDAEPEANAGAEADADPPADADPDADAEPEADPEDEPEPIVVEPWQPPVRKHRWTARLVGLLALGIPAVVVGSVVVRATGLQPEAKIDERLIGALRYDGEGDPLVRAPKADVGAVSRREWRVCGKSCDRISGRGKQFRPGEVLAGSRVEVRVVGASGEATIVTPGWDGQLRALRRPTMTGSPRVGTTVEANPGKWTGGWLGAEQFVGLRACPTLKGGGRCIAFTASALGGADSSARTIPAAFRGWWIGAIEWHVPPGRVVRAQAATDPARPQDGERAPTPGATVKVGPLQGPIR